MRETAGALERGCRVHLANLPPSSTQAGVSSPWGPPESPWLLGQGSRGLRSLFELGAASPPPLPGLRGLAVPTLPLPPPWLGVLRRPGLTLVPGLLLWEPRTLSSHRAPDSGGPRCPHSVPRARRRGPPFLRRRVTPGQAPSPALPAAGAQASGGGGGGGEPRASAGPGARAEPAGPAPSPGVAEGRPGAPRTSRRAWGGRRDQGASCEDAEAAWRLRPESEPPGSSRALPAPKPGSPARRLGALAGQARQVLRLVGFKELNLKPAQLLTAMRPLHHCNPLTSNTAVHLYILCCFYLTSWKGGSCVLFACG